MKTTVKDTTHTANPTKNARLYAVRNPGQVFYDGKNLHHSVTGSGVYTYCRVTDQPAPIQSTNGHTTAVFKGRDGKFYAFPWTSWGKNKDQMRRINRRIKKKKDVSEWTTLDK